MATIAVLAMWRDMADTMTELVARATHRYGVNFHKVYFDDAGAAQQMHDRLTAPPDLGAHEAAPRDPSGATSSSPPVNSDGTPATIKIFIGGHGGIGVDAIESNAGQRKTVAELSDFLVAGLQGIDTSADRRRVTVSMVACLFGRSPDGSLNASPASKLHRTLCDRNVFVELISRTEYLKQLREGPHTMAISDKRRGQSAEDEADNFLHRQPYTKVRHGFDGNNVVVHAIGFDKEDISLSNNAGRKLLWADRTVAELVKLTEDASDPRVTVLQAVLKNYDNSRSPDDMRSQLFSLVNSDSGDITENFRRHRNKLHRPGQVPKKAAAILAALAKWPAV